MAEIEEKGKREGGRGGGGGWLKEEDGKRRGGKRDLDFSGHLVKKKRGIKVCSARWGWRWRAQSGDVLAWASLGLSLMPVLCLA